MPLLPVQTRDALLFWPYDEVALLVPEHAGRWTVVRADGTVAWRPTDAPPDGVWIRFGSTMVHPSFLGRLPDGWTVPPGSPLPMAPPMPSRILHPVDCGGTLVDPNRVRAVRRDEVTLDDGTTLRLRDAAPLAAAFGLPHLDHLEPFPEPHRRLYAMGLRDWPAPLLMLDRQVIQAYVGRDEALLMANVLWQACRLRATGQPQDYGRDHRAFWYLPLKPILARLGFLDDAADWLFTYDDPRYQAYLGVVDRMTDALITFADLGFEEQRPDLRRVGTTHPEVLLVAEKQSLRNLVEALGARFGVSTLVLGGQPSKLASEFAARDLPRVPLHLVAFVDFDPDGWIIARSQAAQLVRHGHVVSRISHLVTPDRFTAQELEWFTVPLRAKDAARQTILDDWLAESGGVGGRPLGIHADYLKPLDRVAAAFQAVTGR